MFFKLKDFFFKLLLLVSLTGYMFSWDLLIQFQVYIQFMSMIDRKKPQTMFLKMKDEMVTVPKWCILSKFRSRYVVFRNHTLDHLKFFQANSAPK